MKHLLSIALLLALSLLSFTANSAAAAVDVRVPENRVIYEVFVRNFSPKGDFKGVEAQVPRLKDLGVDVIWLMPIYKLGDIGKWGTYSSPYAVKDYKAIDPANGTEQDLRDLVKTIHDNGMEIWFDWVGNHTSMDNVWVKEHPEFYKRNGGNFVNPNGWGDVYQLDVNNSAMHDEMIDCMKYWVDNFDIDGYRCDYASGPSPEFWKKASEQVLKDGKRIAWLAEDDSRPELVRNGYFDYNYAWGFRDRMVEFAKGGSLDKLKSACLNLHNDMNYSGRSRMVYLSNHDVVQDQKGSEDKHFGRLLPPMTVLEFTIYGMPLLYNGQEIQYKCNQVLLSEKTPINWNNPDKSMTSLIKTLCQVKHSQPALNTGSQSGMLYNHTASNPDVYVYERRRDGNSVVVMLNFGASAADFTISGALPDMHANEVFTGNKAHIKPGASFSLPAYGYALYVIDEESGISPIFPEEPKPHTLYLKDNTGWNNLYVYGWANGASELFGKWPGISTTINGNDYKTVNFPIGITTGYNLIFNNNNGTQFDGPFLTPDKDYYIEVNANSWEFITEDINTITFDCPDNPNSIYYNLQGVIINNPDNLQPGIYIIKKGNTTNKIMIKNML